MRQNQESGIRQQPHAQTSTEHNVVIHNNEALNSRLSLVYKSSPTAFRAKSFDRLTCTSHPFLNAENFDRKMAMTAIVTAVSLTKAFDADLQ